jgi:hypothetical protein
LATFGQIDADPQPPLSAPEQHYGVVRPLPEQRLALAAQELLDGHSHGQTAKSAAKDVKAR